MAEATLTSKQVRELVLRLDGYHLPQTTLSGWAYQGVIQPTQWLRKRGRYAAVGYTLADVALVRYAARLRKAGLHTRHIRARLAGQLGLELEPLTLTVRQARRALRDVA